MDDDELEELSVESGLLHIPWSWRATAGFAMEFVADVLLAGTEFVGAIRDQFLCSHLHAEDERAARVAADEARELLSALDEL